MQLAVTDILWNIPLEDSYMKISFFRGAVTAADYFGVTTTCLLHFCYLSVLIPSRLCEIILPAGLLLAYYYDGWTSQ